MTRKVTVVRKLPEADPAYIAGYRDGLKAGDTALKTRVGKEEELENRVAYYRELCEQLEAIRERLSARVSDLESQIADNTASNELYSALGLRPEHRTIPGAKALVNSVVAAVHQAQAGRRQPSLGAIVHQTIHELIDRGYLRL